MNFDNLDLNLLKIFIVVHREKNISHAAEKLGMSQSSLSHYVRKLREQLDDPLFVKSGHGVVPTPRADLLIAPIEKAINSIQSIVTESSSFECQHQARTFVLSMSDFGEFVILPKLIEKLTKISPNIEIKVVPSDVTTLEKSLFDGEVDLAIGYLPMINEKFRSQRLVKVDWVSVVRSGHPILQEEMTAENFSKYPHASFTRRAGRNFTDIDVALDKLGLSRKVVLEVPSFVTLPQIVSRSNFVTTVPRQMIDYLSSHREICLIEPPLILDAIFMNQYWHERLHNDPSHTWFRSVLFELFQNPEMI